MICLSGQTVSPSLTLPAHFSIFTSLPPYSHGVMTNTAAPDMSGAAQSLFAHIKTLGGTTAAFYSWDHLRNLAFPGQVDYTLIQRSGTAGHCRSPPSDHQPAGFHLFISGMG